MILLWSEYYHGKAKVSTKAPLAGDQYRDCKLHRGTPRRSLCQESHALSGHGHLRLRASSLALS